MSKSQCIVEQMHDILDIIDEDNGETVVNHELVRLHICAALKLALEVK